MKRRLGSVIVATSLLLFAVVLAMWVRSYWRSDMLIHGQPSRQSAASSHSGRLILETMGDTHVPIWSHMMWSAPRGADGWTRESDSLSGLHMTPFIDHPAARARRFLGFAYANVGSAGMPTRRMIALAIPYWSIALLSLLPPVIAFGRARRRRRAARNSRCLTCGYDLRASAERCPECGTRISDVEEHLEHSIPLPR